MSKEQNLNIEENQQLNIAGVMPSLFGICTQDGLVELFWDKIKAENKIPIYKKDHQEAIFWVQEVIVS